MNPSAGELSRTASFSPSGLEDLRAVEHILRQDKGEEAAKRAPVSLISGSLWRARERHCLFQPSPVLSTVFTFGFDSG